MKKFLMTIAAVFAAVNMNAQYYVGGTINFGNDKTPGLTSETTKTAFTIAPEIGMALDDQLGVGLAINFNTNTNKVEDKTLNTSTDVTTTSFDLRPYARYQLLKWGKANIFVDGGVDFGITSQKDYKAGMNIGLFVQPGFAFNINEQWSIVAKLENMFTLGYAKGMVPDVTGAPDAPTSFGANIASGGRKLEDLYFGVYYNF